MSLKGRWNKRNLLHLFYLQQNLGCQVSESPEVWQLPVNSSRPSRLPDEGKARFEVGLRSVVKSSHLLCVVPVKRRITHDITLVEIAIRR
jgi:hypothetical protein